MEVGTCPVMKNHDKNANCTKSIELWHGEDSGGFDNFVELGIEIDFVVARDRACRTRSQSQSQVQPVKLAMLFCFVSRVERCLDPINQLICG